MMSMRTGKDDGKFFLEVGCNIADSSGTKVYFDEDPQTQKIAERFVTAKLSYSRDTVEDESRLSPLQLCLIKNHLYLDDEHLLTAKTFEQAGTITALEYLNGQILLGRVDNAKAVIAPFHFMYSEVLFTIEPCGQLLLYSQKEIKPHNQVIGIEYTCHLFTNIDFNLKMEKKIFTHYFNPQEYMKSLK